MLCIRLQRTCSRNTPTYRLIAINKRSAAKGKPQEILGFYMPARNPPIFEFKKDRIDHWMKNGALPSDTVARLLSKNGIKGLESYQKRYTKQKSKSAATETPQAPVAAAATATKAEKKAEETAKTDSGDKEQQ